MELKIYNRLINTPIKTILEDLKKELNNGLLKDIVDKGDNLMVTCPHHKQGLENHPSCFVYTKDDNPEVEKGYFHCFTCDYKAPLYRAVGECFGEDDEFGKQWLIDRYGDTYVVQEEYLPEIDLNNVEEPNYLNESILQKYEYYHPYMWERKLTKEIVDKFEVGYNKDTDSLTFPIRDYNNNLVMITERSVSNKHFHLEKNVNKPVYLLNYVKDKNYPFVIVTEGQIDALTAWSYGQPAIALMGLGSKYQYNILNKCPIRHYVLMLDSDNAGRKGASNFIKNIRKDVLVTDILIKGKKDINELSKEEFDNLLKEENLI